jgi:hypothetical protein
MGRHSMRTYRPAHSAHGGLYWALFMWPVVAGRAIAQLRERRDLDARMGDAPSPSEDERPALPRASSGLADTWRADEGGVKPTWENAAPQGVRSRLLLPLRLGFRRAAPP